MSHKGQTTAFLWTKKIQISAHKGLAKGADQRGAAVYFADQCLVNLCCTSLQKKCTRVCMCPAFDTHTHTRTTHVLCLCKPLAETKCVHVWFACVIDRIRLPMGCSKGFFSAPLERKDPATQRSIVSRTLYGVFCISELLRFSNSLTHSFYFALVVVFSSRIESWFHRQHLGYLADESQDWRLTFYMLSYKDRTGKRWILVKADQIVLISIKPVEDPAARAWIELISSWREVVRSASWTTTPLFFFYSQMTLRYTRTYQTYTYLTTVKLMTEHELQLLASRHDTNSSQLA